MDWYKHYAARFLTGTAHMDFTRRGAYITLLDHQWERGGYLPETEAEVVRISGAQNDEEKQALKSVLSEKFLRGKRGYYNRRMLATIREANDIREKRRKAGHIRQSPDSAYAEASGGASGEANGPANTHVRALARDARLTSLSPIPPEGTLGESKDAEAIVTSWNDWAKANGRPGARLTKTLRGKIGARLREGFDWEAIRPELDRIDGFARGETQQWNGITLHWLVENDTNWTKLVAGNYRDRARKGPEHSDLTPDFSYLDER